MKNLYKLLLLSLLLAASHLYSQNDTLYVYKAGIIINKQSIKTVDVDSITFYKPTPVVSTEQSPVQKNLVNMLQGLGLMSVSSTSKTTAKMSSQKGDITAMKYTDSFAGAKYDLKINEEASADDSMVYEGTSENVTTGGVSAIRRTLKEITNGLSIKEEVKVNGEYASRGTKEYTSNSDNTVNEFTIKTDESRRKDFVLSPNSVTSLVKKDANTGEEFLVDNILIVQK